MKIIDIKARQILDSRGNPTVEVDLITEGGGRGRAAVPSGASTGAFEAHELRDGGTRYNGKGVTGVCENITGPIASTILHQEIPDQASLDRQLIDLDGTDNKSQLGANALLGTSLAFAKAAAAEKGCQLFEYISACSDTKTGDYHLPLPFINVFNGGAHANNSTSIQEFMLVPHGDDDFAVAIEKCMSVFHQLGTNLRSQGHSTAVGDEGGYSASLPSDEAAIELLLEAISDTGLTPGKDISIALDVAASELLEDNLYRVNDQKLNQAEMIQWLETLTNTYPIVSIEDGLGEEDWDGWATLQAKLGQSTLIVGDDLLVTNTDRLKQAVEEEAANTILIKPNQIGTLTETIEAITMAHKAGWGCMISHRSGETSDTTIAHLAIGTGANYIKTGSLSRGERVEKYNELLRIGEHTGSFSMPSPLHSRLTS